MQNVKSSFCALLWAASAFFTPAASAREVLYANPVLRGDFADPSVIRVGEDYWATATSSEWAPLFPLLHSRDLVNWELKGQIFPRKPAWSSRNYWAPEISVHQGKFYVYYTARKNEKEGVLHVAVATADQPEGPWTDRGPLIGQPEGSIDGMDFQEENGERYLLWKNDGNSRQQPTMVWAQKLSADGTKLVGAMQELLRNDAAWEGNLIEGPFALKHDGWYYIFYSGNGCCGKGCSYGLGVARSQKLLGPYEKCPANPILAANEKWKCPGHGSVVRTADGRDFFLYHAYEARDSVYVGRQGLLDEIKWGADGWPKINHGQGPSHEAASPLGKAQTIHLAFEDDFDGKQLGVRWQWPHTLEPVAKLEKGQLVLSSPVERKEDLLGSVVAVSTMTSDYAATVLLDAPVDPKGTQAGLFAFGDQHNALGLTLGGGKVSLHRIQKNKKETLAMTDAPVLAKNYLRMEVKDGHRFQFFVWDGKGWKIVGNGDLEGDYLPPWDRGVRIALTVGGAEKASVKYEWLRIVPQGGTTPF